MLVQNSKCQICGANKVTPNKSMYIYCDYCGSWMGFDMDSATREAASTFSVGNMSNPEVVEYNQLNAKLVEFAKAKDVEGFIKTRLVIHEKEFEMFPERHGPKGKQSAFRNKYMIYYEAMYKETITDEYLEKTYINPRQINSDNIKCTVVDGVVKYEMDDAFFEFFDANWKVVTESMESSKDLKCVNLHPEYEVVKNSDLMLKITLNSMIQAYGSDAAGPIYKHLGMDSKMIEIPDVNINEMNCVVCNSDLLVPEGAKSVMCVDCGCKNEVTLGQISCPNCAAPFDPIRENETCPYCNSKIEKPKSMHDFMKEKYVEATSPQPKKSKKGFWGKLFG